MGVLARDLRYALTAARRNKGSVAAAILTLAIGIGASVAVFSIIDGVLLRPLPYPDAGRLVRLFEERPGAVSPLGAHFLSNVTFHAWSVSGSSTLAGMAAYDPREFTVGFSDESVRLSGAAVSSQLFTLLGATPAVGRFFRADEGRPGVQPVVVLSHKLWRQRFQEESGVVGRTLLIDGRSHVVVGIAGPALEFPDREARLWTPYAVAEPSGTGYARKVSALFALGRLRAGMTPSDAAVEGTAAARRAAGGGVRADLLFGVGGPVEVRVRPIVEEMTARVRPALLVVATGVALVLIIACANVTSLWLSRGVSRQRELGIRTALGATHGRLVRQLLTESAALSLVAGGVGVLLGAPLIGSATLWAPHDFPRIDNVRFDGRVLMVALAGSVLTVILSGVVPALRSTAFGLFASIHEGAGGPLAGFGDLRARRFQNALIVVEAALAVIVLVGAMLLARSLVRLTSVDGGYDARNVLTARIDVPAASSSPERRQQLADTVVARLRGMPGVIAAGAGNMMPFAESTYLSAFEFPSREHGGKLADARALEYVVTPGFGEALGLRVQEGRLFTERDTASAISPVLVNEEFARLYLSGRPIAGRIIRTGIGSSDKPAEIIGVVGNVLKDGLETKPQPEIYLLSPDGMPLRQICLLVRTTGDPSSIVPGLRRVIRESDPAAAIVRAAPLRELIAESVGQPRFAAAVMSAFAALALGLAAVGLHAVLTYTLARRRREFGVRIALGATRSDLIALVLGQGMRLTLGGTAIGLAGAALLSRLMERLLFGIRPLDGVSFSAAATLVLTVAFAACLVPAVRASSADPVEGLRSE